jgi:DNA-binding transcriptional LysR family regulator
MLSVHQLNVFLIAADTLNFTQTAKMLHLTQSNVSQHIKSLEGQLGVELFHRKGRTIELTTAGEVLLPHARDIVGGALRATEQMELLKSEVHGSLIIGCNTAPGKYILPLLLAQFHEQYPMVKISCQVLPMDKTLELLEMGLIQFAMLNRVGDSETRAEFQLFLDEPILLIVPKGHPWEEKGVIEPEMLFEEKFIMREQTSSSYQDVRQGLANVGVDVDNLNTFLEMGTSEAVALAVEQGLGIGFISRLILEKICPGRVSVVDIQGVCIVQNIYMGRQTIQSISSAQAAFWEYVQERGRQIFSEYRQYD